MKIKQLLALLIIFGMFSPVQAGFKSYKFKHSSGWDVAKGSSQNASKSKQRSAFTSGSGKISLIGGSGSKPKFVARSSRSNHSRFSLYKPTNSRWAWLNSNFGKHSGYSVSVPKLTATSSSASVPEPATIALVFCGLIGLAVSRRVKTGA